MHDTFSLNVPTLLIAKRNFTFGEKIEQHIPQGTNLPAIFFSLFACLEDDIKAKVEAVLWSIWRSRNALWWNRKPFDITRIGLLVHDTIRYYNW
ncbi:hypothetical protein QL285_061804 [Trifolium repens]|jgi:hypothetical protein|nr:hypothetical protein QL285_061804 [Trifolium repens]